MMPFAATWMDLEIVILREVNQIEKDKHKILLISESKKNDTNELIYKMETDSQIQRMNLQLPGGKGGGRIRLGVWD